MGTSVTETTSGGFQPPPGSLQAAQERLMGLLSDPEDKQPVKTQPEQSPKAEGNPPDAAASATEQAPAAASTESEQAASPEPQEPEATPVPLVKVKINGQDKEVPLEEALKGYSRTEDYTRKTQQLAEKNRLLAEKEAAVEAERQRLATGLAEYEQAIRDVTPEKPNWDLRRLQVTPEVLAQEMLAWDKNQQYLAEIRAKRAEIEETQAASNREKFNKFMEQEHELLNAALPEIADPTTGDGLRTSIKSYAKGQGFTDEQIDVAGSNHRLVILLHKAMQWDKAQANKPKVENKIASALATPAPQNRTPAAPKNKLAEAKSRLEKTGRMEDAVAAFYQLLPD